MSRIRLATDTTVALGLISYYTGMNLGSMYKQISQIIAMHEDGQ